MSHKISSLFYLVPRTGMHCGSGSSLEVIDLPIQRERVTGYPVIHASSLKGAMRSNFTSGDLANSIFGPEKPSKDGHYAAAISFTDARLLFFPVRSFKGVFAMVTCPHVLRRFAEDAKMAGLAVANSIPGSIEVKEEGDIHVAGESEKLCVEGKGVVLEEYAFDSVQKDLGWLESLLPGQFAAHAGRLAIVSNDTFSHFVTTSTEVNARIRMDKDKRTAQGGALWFEEYLPAESILYSVVFAVQSRDGSKKSAEEVLTSLREGIPDVVQVGGNETIGKGLAACVWAGRDGE